MQLANYLGYLHRAELNLAEGFRKVADSHAVEVDIYHTCNTLAKQCEAHAEKLQPFVERYGEEKPEGAREPIPRTLRRDPLGRPRASARHAGSVPDGQRV